MNCFINDDLIIVNQIINFILFFILPMMKFVWIEKGIDMFNISKDTIRFIMTNRINIILKSFGRLENTIRIMIDRNNID